MTAHAQPPPVTPLPRDASAAPWARPGEVRLPVGPAWQVLADRATDLAARVARLRAHGWRGQAGEACAAAVAAAARDLDEAGAALGEAAARAARV